MTQLGASWADLLASLAERMGEPDMGDSSTLANAESNMPYFNGNEAERWLYYASLYFLRKTPIGVLQSVGSDAIVTLTNAVPINTVRFLSGQVNFGAGYKPATFIPPARYVQMSSLTLHENIFYTVMDGALLFQYPGATIKVTALVEPTLEQFQADDPILPGTYDEDRIDRARQYLLIQDFLPGGRL